MAISKRILPIIVIAQFCCTSLWFASNGVIDAIISEFNLHQNALGYLTSAIQCGFIIGTLTFAILNISDRFSPSKIFFYCAILGSLFNLGITWQNNTLTTLLLFRFLTGFFLAGIYPVGMKIAADYFQKGLGKSLGYLVGALVLGTAFPHLLSQITSFISWGFVITSTSILAVIGGFLMLLFIPDGPHRTTSKTIDLSSFISIFKEDKFRNAAFGYFGHMWELYTFWTFIPIILKTYNESFIESSINVSLFSFLIISIGSIACVISGYASIKFGLKKTIVFALLISGSCCLISPLIFGLNSKIIFLTFLFIWGITVIMDSPLLSTLVAKNATPDKKGTALTIVNCIGFCISIISIQLTNYLLHTTNSNFVYLLLAIGPIFGILSLLNKRTVNSIYNHINNSICF